jgi:hypothetical protein
MDFKKTAQDLIKLAEKLEKEASDNSYFICSSCNHTATLTQINDRRAKYAAQDTTVVLNNKVTVNDTIACGVPGCDGKMAYVASDESEKYYVDDKVAEETPGILDIDETLSDPDEKKEEKPKAKKTLPFEDNPDVGDSGEGAPIEAPAQEPPANPIENPVPPKAPAEPVETPQEGVVQDTSINQEKPPVAPETPPEDISAEPEQPEGDIKPEDGNKDQDELDIDNLFEDVDTQNQKQKAEKKNTVQNMEEARLENKAKKDLAELREDGQEGDGEGDTFPPADKDPMINPAEKTEPDPAALKDQPESVLDPEGEEVEKPKKTPKTKEEELLEKKNVPKFKSKEASERFVKALDRYNK